MNFSKLTRENGKYFIETVAKRNRESKFAAALRRVDSIYRIIFDLSISINKISSEIFTIIAIRISRGKSNLWVTKVAPNGDERINFFYQSILLHSKNCKFSLAFRWRRKHIVIIFLSRLHVVLLLRDIRLRKSKTSRPIMLVDPCSANGSSFAYSPSFETQKHNLKFNEHIKFVLLHFMLVWSNLIRSETCSTIHQLPQVQIVHFVALENWLNRRQIASRVYCHWRPLRWHVRWHDTDEWCAVIHAEARNFQHIFAHIGLHRKYSRFENSTFLSAKHENRCRRHCRLHRCATSKSIVDIQLHKFAFNFIVILWIDQSIVSVRFSFHSK